MRPSPMTWYLIGTGVLVGFVVMDTAVLGIGDQVVAAQAASWRRQVAQGAPILRDGRREWVTFQELDTDEDDFDALGAAFGHRARRGKAGRGEALLMRQRELVDFAAEWIAVNRRAPSS